MRKRLGALSPRKLAFILGSIVLYILVLAVLLVLFNMEEEPTQAVFGSMEDRFRSDVQMEHQGEVYSYRENEITNYLILGVDHQNTGRSTGYQSGGQSDFLVVLSIDRVRRTITPLMLDRDTMAPVHTFGIFGNPSGTRQMQLCLAHAYSGPDTSSNQNTVDTVEALLHGIEIHHFIAMSMPAVPVLNDALGGVVITLEDDFSSYDPAMVPGATVHLMGEQAEFFVRGRLTVADGTNASRMRRQQQYVEAFLELMKQEMDKDTDDVASRLLDAVSTHTETDASRDILLRDIQSYENYHWLPLRTLEGTHAIDEYGFAEFWPDEEALRSLIADIWFTKEEH